MQLSLSEHLWIHFLQMRANAAPKTRSGSEKNTTMPSVPSAQDVAASAWRTTFCKYAAKSACKETCRSPSSIEEAKVVPILCCVDDDPDGPHLFQKTVR